MRRIPYLLALTVGFLLTLAPSAAALPFNGSIIATCDQGLKAQVDPIVSWGVMPSAHEHAFFGSTVVGASTTYPGMVAGGTSCDIKTDKAAFWVPAVVKDGQVVYPTRSSYYIRGANRGGPVTAWPAGLRWVSGNPNNTSSGTAAGRWSCGGSGTALNYIPTNCNGLGVQMTQYITSCWDGKRYGPGGGGDGGPANGRDHIASTTAQNTCPASHPVIIPSLQLLINYPPAAVGGRLVSDAPLAAAGSSQHADYFDGWTLNSEHARSIELITSRCLNVDGLGGAVTCRVDAVTGDVVMTSVNPLGPAGTYVTD